LIEALNWTIKAYHSALNNGIRSMEIMRKLKCDKIQQTESFISVFNEDLYAPNKP